MSDKTPNPDATTRVLEAMLAVQQAAAHLRARVERLGGVVNNELIDGGPREMRRLVVKMDVAIKADAGPLWPVGASLWTVGPFAHALLNPGEPAHVEEVTTAGKVATIERLVAELNESLGPDSTLWVTSPTLTGKLKDFIDKPNDENMAGTIVRKVEEALARRAREPRR